LIFIDDIAYCCYVNLTKLQSEFINCSTHDDEESEKNIYFPTKSAFFSTLGAWPMPIITRKLVFIYEVKKVWREREKNEDFFYNVGAAFQGYFNIVYFFILNTYNLHLVPDSSHSLAPRMVKRRNNNCIERSGGEKNWGFQARSL
jgi:hypothetical protein